MFQVTQYKTFQILVQTFPEPWARGSPSVFHFRNRQRFQVPGFEWVHELLLFCLASNPAQFCAEISCGKTELEHNCTISRFRMKNVFSVCRRGALPSYPICCGDSGGRAGCVTKPYKNYTVQILESELVLTYLCKAVSQ